MADAYLDHGAYATNLGTTPTWGVPQEGDGTSKDAATAAGTASIVFTANATGGSSSITLLGITFTATTHFAVGGSLSATLDNLVAAINANSGQGAATVASGVAYGMPKLCNLVFARNTGTDTLEVMMRVGSTALNGATNTNCRLTCANWSTSTSLPVDFAGGTGGCWGWFLNTAAIGVSSSIAARNYGLLVTQPMVAGGGYAFAEMDRVFVRTGRNTTLSVGPLMGNFYSLTTKPGFVNFVFDTNTVWTGDGTSGVLRLNIDNTVSSYSVGFSYGGGEAPKYMTYKALALGGYTIGFSFVGGGTFEYDSNGTAFGYSYENIKFVEMGTTGSATSWRFDCINSTQARRSFVGCEFDFSACQRTDLKVPAFRLRQGSLTLIGNYFKYTLTGVGGAALAVPLVGTTDASAVVGDVTMRGNRAEIGQPGELRALQFLSGGTAAAGFNAVIENNKGLGLVSGSAGILNSTVQASTAALALDNLAVGGGAHYEDRRGYWQWVPGQPVLSATSPDGTVWSWVGYWTNAAQIINPAQPMVSPASRLQSRLATGVRTLTVEMLLDSVALADLPTYGKIEVSYTDSGGTPRCELATISLASSSAVWTNVGSAPYNTWVARKATVTTAQQVPINGIVNMRLHIARRILGGSTAAFAFDPEPAMT